MSIEFAEGYDAGLGACRAELARLRAENEALRADAERYRWLRNDNSPFGWQNRNGLSAEQIDSAIDAARKEEQS